MNEQKTIRMWRFTRRGRAKDRPHTSFISNMVDAYNDMATNRWNVASTPPSQTRVTGNDIYFWSYDFDWLDAARQVCNAGRTGYESSLCDTYASMAAYRLTRPVEAGTDPWKKISFRLNADKFALGGLKVAVFLSNEPQPPFDMEVCRSGGTDDEVELAGRMSTEEFDFEWNEDVRKIWAAAVGRSGKLDNHENPNIPSRIGVLAATKPVLGDNPPREEVFEINIQDTAKAYQFCYIIISMFTADSWRTEYFVEGSGFITYNRIVATIGNTEYRVGKELFVENHGWRVAMNMAQEESGTGQEHKVSNVASKHKRYKYRPVNINDEWFSLDWGVKMALGDHKSIRITF